jgi:hypothetical protein
MKSNQQNQHNQQNQIMLQKALEHRKILLDLQYHRSSGLFHSCMSVSTGPLLKRSDCSRRLSRISAARVSSISQTKEGKGRGKRHGTAASLARKRTVEFASRAAVFAATPTSTPYILPTAVPYFCFFLRLKYVVE